MQEKVLLQLLSALKTTPRTGWLLRGVPPAIAETIAGHSLEASLIALVLAERLREKGVNVNPYLASSIAATHDTAEAFIGDIVKRAVDLIGRERKEAAEIRIAQEELGGSLLGKLVTMYISQDTLEARVAKAAETLSTLVQALRYIEIGYDVYEILCSMKRTLEKLMQTEPAIREPIKTLFKKTLNKVEKVCKEEGRESSHY